MPTICSITLKIRKPENEDAKCHLGFNAGELSDALISTMKNGRIIWDVDGGVARASFDVDKTEYAKRALKCAVEEFKEDDEIDCEMTFASEFPSAGDECSSRNRHSFFSKLVSRIRGFCR